MEATSTPTESCPGDMSEPELAVVRMRSLDESQSPSIRSDGSGYRKSSLYVYGDGQFSITLKHYDSIVSEVKCPGCAEPMDGPITMCGTGHSICAVCRAKRGTCPLCGDRVTELRNYTLEAIVSKVQFPCKNSAKGCAVRLPLQLLRWHKERCGYKLIECFMGKVWGACGWHGCERDWMAHCLEAHADHVYQDPTVELRWEFGAEASQRASELQLVVAYHVLCAYGEAFNLYQVYDQDSRTVLWTVICTTKESKVSSRFAFELELYSPIDSWKLLVQRFPCHSELDPDFLKDGHCSKIPLADAMRFMTEDKVLHYRVRVLEVGPSRSQSLMKLSNGTGSIASTSHLPTNYCCKNIENVNLKAVPEGNIICRKQPSINTEPLTAQDDDDVFLPYVDADEESTNTLGKSVRPPYEQSSPNRSSNLRMAASVPMLAQMGHLNDTEPPSQVELQPIQQLVRVKVAEREHPVKMQAQYAVRKQSTKTNGNMERGSSSESLATKSSKGTGLSKFYNVTMYKAAKFLDKKGIK
ncbi:E3 ubiquitin-protein ligase SIAH2 [Anopheles stephensi]|uniref:E3 ubiquitin-protein ligase SIAH2 n=1 Tax=Anopheles stephensi TaxID=30069 RepID=UPI0016587E96|nr:E3 ubiquitin-protein ligase SIAH2 [Anopheles stephensi]